MRIAHVITRFIRGGADENTLYSCNGQAAQGHDVLLVHGDESDEPLRKQLDPRVVVVRLSSLRRPIHPRRDWQAYAACVELFRKWRPDIVHTHTSKAGIVGRWAAWRAKVPVVIHGIHILPHVNEGWLQRHVFLAIERASARITDAFVNVGQDMMDQALRDRIGRPDQHLVIPSGMDLEKFRSAARQLSSGASPRTVQPVPTYPSPLPGGESTPDFVRTGCPVTGGGSDVAQTGSLLCRRLATGGPADCQSAKRQVTNLRYVEVTGQGEGAAAVEQSAVFASPNGSSENQHRHQAQPCENFPDAPLGLPLPRGEEERGVRQSADMGWKKVLGSAAEGLPDDPRFIVLVSRLEQRKGQSAFLEVFQRIARRVPQAVLLLAGEGPERAALEARVKELNLNGRVVFAGFREDVENLLSIAAVGLLTSRREGLPRVIIQYTLAGLPVVATDIPGVREVIEPGVHGFTAPPDDLSGMEEPLVRLLTDEAFREEMAAPIRAKDFSAWSIESMVGQLDRLYRKLAAWSEPPGIIPLPVNGKSPTEDVGEKAA